MEQLTCFDNHDYLRYIAQELKNANVDSITPDQLIDLANYLHIEATLNGSIFEDD